MANSSFYTKGDRESVTSRMNQVHTITMFCPTSDSGVQSLKNTLEMMLPKYKISKDMWKNIPSIDALNAFIFTASYLKNSGVETDNTILSIIVSSLKMFNKLKNISFKFTDDENVELTYSSLLRNAKDAINVKKCIYNVDLLELNLSDMFSQSVIDLINKIFVCNELIPNSYLKRRFILDFKYDDYISFIDMFLSNNKEHLDMLDNKIADYLRAFPPLVNEQKPHIRIVTNYSD